MVGVNRGGLGGEDAAMIRLWYRQQRRSTILWGDKPAYTSFVLLNPQSTLEGRAVTPLRLRGSRHAAEVASGVTAGYHASTTYQEHDARARLCAHL